MHNIRSTALQSVAIMLISAAPLAFGAEKPAPVKVYILAGQSNMVGIGQVGPMGATRFNSYASSQKDADRGITVSIYEGEYDPSADYDDAKALDEQHLNLGFWPHTSLDRPEEPSFAIGRGYIRVDRAGEYSFRTTANSILQIDGKVAFDGSAENAEPTQIYFQPGTYPIKVTFLGSISSMLSHNVWDTPGTLNTLVRQHGQFPYLIDEDGEWISRDDVWYKGVITASADKWLSVGCGANSSQIGPELGFGHIVGDYHKEPVLLLKTSQGNRSLAWDFLPPGSERFEIDGVVYAGYKDPNSSWPAGTEPDPINWYAGKQYDDCFSAAQQILENFDANFPHWAGRGYEIAGFAWWQGHKDSGNDVHASRYEQNLVHLIKTLRKQFKAPKAPFVVATIGFDGWDMNGNMLTIANAQLAVDGTAGKYPEFAKNVKTVETRNFWPEAADSPKSQSFHYHQNAGTYMFVGEAMGRGMLELHKQ